MRGKKPWYFMLIAVGLCFFFNPYLATIDLLPDFVGALLIFAGLIPLSHVFLPLHDAKRAFLYVALADAVKQLLLMFVFGMGNTGEQETLLLVVALLSASVGAVLTVRAVGNLFDGLDMLAGSFEALPLYGEVRQGRSRTELLRRYSIFFIIFREVVSLLPEFSALLNSTYLDNGFIRLYDYIGTMRLMVAIPVLLLGVYWLCRVLLYFKLLFRQTALIEGVGDTYRKYVASHPGIRVKSRYAVAFISIFFGFLLLADFYVDYKNIFSDTLGGVFLLVGILLFRLSYKQRLGALLSGLAYTVLATLSTNQSYLFSTRFFAGNIGRDPAVAAAYQTMWLFALAEFLAFSVFLAFFLVLLRRLFVAEGGYIEEGEVSEFSARHKKAEGEEFDRGLIKAYLFGFFGALCSFLFDYLKDWPDTKIFRLLEVFWAVDFLVVLGAAIYCGYLLTVLFAKIKERYRFE